MKKDKMLKLELEAKLARRDISFEDMGALSMIRADAATARGERNGCAAVAFGFLGYLIVPVVVLLVMMLLGRLGIVKKNAYMTTNIVLYSAIAGIAIGIVFSIVRRKRKFKQLNDLEALRAAFREQFCKKKKIDPSEADAYFAEMDALPELTNASRDGAIIRCDDRMIMAFCGRMLGVVELDKDVRPRVDHMRRAFYGELYLGAYESYAEAWKVLKQLREATQCFRLVTPAAALMTAMLNSQYVLMSKIAELSGIKSASLKWYKDIDTEAVKEAKKSGDADRVKRMEQLTQMKSHLHLNLVDGEGDYISYYPHTDRVLSDIAEIRRANNTMTQMEMLQYILEGKKHSENRTPIDPVLNGFDLGFEELLYPEIEYQK